MPVDDWAQQGRIYKKYNCHSTDPLGPTVGAGKKLKAHLATKPLMNAQIVRDDAVVD